MSCPFFCRPKAVLERTSVIIIVMIIIVMRFWCVGFDYGVLYLPQICKTLTRQSQSCCGSEWKFVELFWWGILNVIYYRKWKMRSRRWWIQEILLKWSVLAVCLGTSVLCDALSGRNKHIISCSKIYMMKFLIFRRLIKVCQNAELLAHKIFTCVHAPIIKITNTLINVIFIFGDQLLVIRDPPPHFLLWEWVIYRCMWRFFCSRGQAMSVNVCRQKYQMS